MEVVYTPGQMLTAAECYITPALLASGSPLLPAFLNRVTGGLRQTVEGLSRTGGEKYEEYLAILGELQQLEETYGNRG